LKNILLILIISYVGSFAKIGQEELVRTENDGYFTNIAASDRGIIATNNLDNALYLIIEGHMRVLLENPGCGRFYSVRGGIIGFKFIDTATGKQSPALLDISTGKITELAERSHKCGQVSFSNTGKIAFTVGNDLFITDYENRTEIIPLGTYSNVSQISPDGCSVCFHDGKQNLFLLDLSTKTIIQITEDGEFFNQKWSPDSKILAFQSLSGKLFIHNFATGTVEGYGNVKDFSWISPDKLLITKTEHDEESLLSSDIFEIDITAGSLTNLTDSPENYEISPCLNGNNLYYSNFGKAEIYSAVLTSKHLNNLNIEYSHPGILELKDNIINGAYSKDMLTVPYINQVFHTDSYAHGYGCCAATSCAMVLAYYKIIPHWETSNNNWAHVIFDNYYYNNFNYNIPYDTGGTGGGDGFMWNDNGHGGSSPSTNQVYYLRQHRLTSTQYWSNWWAAISSHLASGYLHPMCVMITASGHLIDPIGIADAGQQLLYYNDPYGNKNIAYPYENGAGVLYDWPPYNTGHASIVSVAWTTSAIGTMPSSPDLTVDERQLAYTADYNDFDNLNDGFWMLADGITGMKYWRNIDDGKDSYWWTGAMTGTSVDDYSASWNPVIIYSGNYKVEAFIPANTEIVTNAKYKIYHNGTMDLVIGNQSAGAGTWISLGTHYFSGTGSEYIYLGDATGSKDIKSPHAENEKITYKIIYDKIRLTYSVPGFTYGGDWQYGTDTLVGSVSGGNIWGTVLNANHSDNTNSSLIYDISASPLPENSILSFDHWYQAECSGSTAVAYDGGNVKASVNGGTSWEILYPLPDYTHTISSAYANPMPGEPAYSGTSDGWVHADFDLATFAGENVKIKWQFGSDALYTYRGWYLDNISVSQMLPPENVTVTISDSNIDLVWNEAEHANYYIIDSSDQPDSGFTQLGTSPVNSWNGTIDTSSKKFYRIRAVLQYDK